MPRAATSQLSGSALQPFIAIENKNVKRFVEGTHKHNKCHVLCATLGEQEQQLLKNIFSCGVDHYSSSFTNSWPPIEEHFPEGPTLKIATK